jgi:hypothetical protein
MVALLGALRAAITLSGGATISTCP